MAISESNLSAADVAAVMRGNCGYGGGMGGGMGWGGEGMWWIIILFVLAALFGNGFGFGGNNGGGFGGGNHFYGGYGCGSPCATQADVRNAVDQQTLISKLDQQTYGLADATYALNNAITGGFAQAELSRCSQQAALMAQLCNMQADAAKCCCETQRLIERGFADTNYNMATQFCETRHQSEKNTRDIIENANTNARAILDFLTKDKIESLRDENQNLRFAASQANQNSVIRAAIDASTAEVIRRTGNDCPIPAYWVSAPTPVQAPCSWTHGANYNNNCGCGNGGYAYA